MRFGEVFNYRTAEKAKQYIGKTGCFSDSLFLITETPMEIMTERPWTLVGVHTDEIGRSIFIKDDGYAFQFFRPVLEEEDLMTNRQFAEWLSRGNGEYAIENGSLVATHFSYSKSTGDDPVDDYVIRRWNDTEWSKPSKAIYEEDCISTTAINELPPHGRLIDADALQEHYEALDADNGDYTESASETAETIANAPTILEASE